MNLFEDNEALGRLNDLIRIGEVSSINPEKCTARVVFDDDDSIVSYDLPIIQRNTLNSHDFHSVNVGEDVLCIFLPSGPEEGFILGSFYAGEVTPPERTEKRRTTVFEDGTVVQYDMAAHTLTVIIDGTSIVFDRQNGTVTVPQTCTINCTTAIVNASEHVEIDTPSTHVTGTLTVDRMITGRGGMTVTGGSGSGASIQCTGDINATGDVVGGGISLQNHTHTEQGYGAETSSAH